MSERNSLINSIAIGGVILFFITVLIAILAWITYGTLEGVLGALTYAVVGLLCVYPWIIPFIGFVLGLLDIFGVVNLQIYEQTLSIAHLESSWMSFAWYWTVSVLSIIINLLLSIIIISKFNSLRYRKKEPKTNLALVNCKIIDGIRDSKIIENGVILIKNITQDTKVPGLISALGESREITIPKDYKLINLTGMYVLPGLINMHCHLTGGGKPTKMMNVSDEVMELGARLLKKRVVRAVIKKLMIKNMSNALNAGVTTLRCMSDPEYIDVKLRKEIEKGRLIGPRLIVAGKGICITGGHGGPMAYNADSIPEIRKAIRKNLRHEVDWIKILSTGGVMDAHKIGEAGRPEMTLEEIETACFEAHRGGLMVATHCESTQGIKEALLGGVDTIEHGADITPDLVPLFKKNPKSLRGYTVLIPTISAGMGLSMLPIKTTKITQEKCENAKLVQLGMIKGLQKARKEGIRFGLGTDASVPFSTHYNVWKELKYFMKYTGMTAQEALYYGTKGNAELLGIDNITGSIEVGKSADLQVVAGNPLENIDNLEKVVKVVIQGQLINNPKIKKVKKVEKSPITKLFEA